ncbi:MAG: hypothetical protein QXS20_07465 [Candidatus Thorarchaeota archaeon]
MTSPEPIEEIVPRILKNFSASPRGWRVIQTPTGEVLISGPESSYQLKLIPLDPFRFTGAGIEIDNADRGPDWFNSSPEFGVRPLSDRDVSALLGTIADPDSFLPRIQRLFQRPPVSPSSTELQDVSHVITGPVISRPNLTDVVSVSEEVQELLEHSATRIFRERYPMRAGMYI